MRNKRSINFMILEVCGLTAAVVAVGALSVSAPALAAPNGEGPVVSISEIVLAGANKESGNRGQDKDLHARSQKLEQGDSRAKRGGGDRDRDDRDWSREDDEDRDRDDRNWSREDGEDGDGYWRRGNRGNHYGWERGKHHGWNKNRGHPRYEDDRKDRRAERRDSGWTGQRIDRIDSQVMRDYAEYGLPQPEVGEYYARSNNDVYLVTEETQRILRSFVLR